jgi:hypothetical protein
MASCTSSESATPKEYKTFGELQDDVEAAAALSSYDAAAIRAEFEAYHALLPKPDQLLQQRHSVDRLRDMIQQQESDAKGNSSSPTHTSSMPRFLRDASEGGIKPHNALCCLLLDDFHGETTQEAQPSMEVLANCLAKVCIGVLSAGRLHTQLHLPAHVIRDQFYRVAQVFPTRAVATLVGPDLLRHQIRNQGLPIPNFFLDPEDPRQFPPHIALLVILQDKHQESRHLHNVLHRAAWLVFAAVALVLRLVLEVIGGAGAIWGGSEVFHLRKDGNHETWRWISVGIGFCCFLRFVTLNAPQQEDEGDILGPAGPWSLRTAARLRAVCEHPFHYFCRAQAPHPAIWTNTNGSAHKNRKQK